MPRYCSVLFLVLLFLIPATIFSQTSMKLVVDATELPRKLLHSQIYIETGSGELALHFPKWIPGTHSPSGPIQNMGGFELFDNNGDRLEWTRDWANHYRFLVRGGETSGPIRAELTYICSQPSTNSVGVDSYGANNLGVINWNTVLVYPEGIPVNQIEVTVELVLPDGWEQGSALPFHGRRKDTLVFEPTTLENLIDMPLICGRYFKTIEFAHTDLASYYIHLAADSDNDLPEKDDSTIVPLTRMAKEAEAVFGSAHFESYHILLILTDEFRTIGLEHRNSSLNGVKASEFRKANWSKKRTPYLLPHEFCHAWCGKYRRPAGMLTDDYMTEKNTSLLWVYEGLDQYMGYVLAARCGYIDSATFVEAIADRIDVQMQRVGRNWRPLHDTEISSGMLRGGSRSWSNLRRNQDYYAEGAIYWMEFDAMIRNGTNGEKSLDDFCALFFNKDDKQAHALPFDRVEIVATLNQVYEAPWDSLIEVRIHQPIDELSLEGVNEIGCKLSFTDKKSSWLTDREGFYNSINHYRSIGLYLSNKGEIRNISSGSPADIAGLVPRSTVVAVNGRKFTRDRLDDAIAATTEGHNVRLLLLNGENYEERTIKYNGGLRYLNLVTQEGRSNLLYDIARPRVTE